MDKRLTEDPRQKGDIAEKLFELECIKRDIPIYAPVNSATRDDYVVVIDGEFKKVQIKYVSLSTDEKVCVSFTKAQNGRSTNLKYTEDEIDLFFVYCPDFDEWYNIPMSLSSTSRTIALRGPNYKPKNNQTKGVRYTTEFKW